ncbi:MAG: hypothetical protein GX070_03955 [Alcaligenaceae bacterium]|nr:hypothetical protein [Alcaligenaceae bacterium]
MTFAFIIPCATNDTGCESAANEPGSGSQPPASAENGYGQLIATVESINQSAKGALISVVEHGATALNDEQKNQLLKQTDLLMEYNSNEIIQSTIQQFAARKDSFNLTELTSLIWFLEVAQKHQVFNKVQRIFVIRPGFIFDAAKHGLSAGKEEAKNKFILPNPYPSAFPSEKTGHIFLQFNTGLWSFETSQIPELLNTLRAMLGFMKQRFQEGGYVDLGHCLYKFIDASHVFYDLGLAPKPANQLNS